MKMIIITVVIAFVIMGIATARYRCFFSQVEGTILVDDRPLEGATITQHYRSHWYDNSTTNTTTTDEQGDFSFPEASRFGFLTLLHQPVIEQELMVDLGYTNLVIWDYSKMNYDVCGEAGPWHGFIPFPDGIDATFTNVEERLLIEVNIMAPPSADTP